MTREERGQDIVKRFRIVKTPRGWRVPSTSFSGSPYLDFIHKAVLGNLAI